MGPIQTERLGVSQPPSKVARSPWFQALDLATPMTTPTWWADYQADGFMVESATAVTRRRASYGSASRAPAYSDWQQQWHSHLRPHCRIFFNDRVERAPDVFEAWVQSEACDKGVAPTQLMAAKVRVLGVDEAQDVRLQLNDPSSLSPPFDPYTPLSLALRDALFGRLVQSPIHARRILATPTALLTLHPLATGDLLDLMGDVQKLTPQLCDGLCHRLALSLLEQLQDFEQQHNVVHNDVKPENILFWEDGTFLFTDFSNAYGAWEAEFLAMDSLGVTSNYAPFDEVLCERDAADAQLMLPWPYGKDIYGLGVTFLYLATGMNPFEVTEGAPMAAIGRRQNLWRELYPQLVAFCHGPALVPQIDLEALPSQSRRRAALWVHAFARLKERAPSIMHAICIMLHPDIDRRLGAEPLAELLEQRQPMRPVSGDEVSDWLRALPISKERRRTMVHAEPWQPLMAPLRRGRRHTLGGGLDRSPWDERRLEHTVPTERAWEVEDLCVLSAAWARSYQSTRVQRAEPPSPMLSELSVLSSTQRWPSFSESLRSRGESSDSLAELPAARIGPNDLFRARSWCKPAKFADHSRRHSMVDLALFGPREVPFWQRTLDFSRRKAASSRSKGRPKSPSSGQLSLITESLSSWMFASSSQHSPAQDAPDGR